MGFYSAAPDVMGLFREQLDEKPKEFLKAIAWFDRQSTFALEGEKYKRPIGQDKPEPIRTWYQYKSFYLCSNHKIDATIRGPGLAAELMTGWDMTRPLYHYLLKTAARAREQGGGSR